MHRAGFWRRATALAVDYVIVVLLITVVTGAAAARLTVSQFERVAAVLPALVCVVYFALEVFPGITVGKLAMGLRIAAPDGAPADGWTRLTRYLTKFFGTFLFAVSGLTGNAAAYFLAGVANFFVALGMLRVLGDDKRAWHDIWSHTAVYPRAPRTVPGFPVQPIAPGPSPDAPVGAPPPL